MKCVFTVDVEDWFHILDLPSSPDLTRWDGLDSRVEHNFRRLLDLFREKDVRVTCFFLGWVAERWPHLVSAAVEGGHDVASHGYAHRLLYAMAPAEFRQDARRAKQVIEDACGREVVGYRASGFSVTERTPWFFEELARAGYRYDSSVFPATRGHGGMRGAQIAPHTVATPAGDIFEFPITIARIFGGPVCLFGGGYLRLAPWGLIRRGAVRVLREGRPVVFYAHPREIDPEQPRLPMSYVRRFKSYVNLQTTEEKIRRILATFEFTTLGALWRQSAERQIADGSSVCV